MATWSYETTTETVTAPQAGKYWLKTVTMNIASAPEGDYFDYDQPIEHHHPQGNAYMTVSWPGGSATGHADRVGSITPLPEIHQTRGNAEGGSITVTVNQILTSGSVTVTYGGGWVGSDTIHSDWDWAYANIVFNYVDGHSSRHSDCQYGTTVYDSHTISHLTNYHGNGGTPNLQTRDQSYTASGSETIDAGDCAQYPGYVSINVPGQTKTFVREGDGIVLPELEDYLFEGWWGVADSRSTRGDEWLDEKSLGQYGTYDCYAHYMSPPIWERRNGAWHKWIPSDMNAQSVNGSITVNNIRSKHPDGTWPLDKPIYRRENGAWVEIKGAMIPPEGS